MPNFPEVDQYYGGGQATLREGFQADAFGPGQNVLPLQQPGLSEDQAIANIRQRFKTQAPGAWNQMSPQEQQQAAMNALQAERARGDNARGIAATPNDIEAQNAIQRVQAFQRREFQYERPEDLARDLEVLRYSNAQRQGQLSDARATQIAEAGKIDGVPFSPGAALMAAADTGSMGLGAGFRGISQPELAGLEGEVASQAPGSTVVGALAGGAPFVGGAANVGARTAMSAVRTRGLTAGGQLQRAGAGILGGFVAGEAAQAPIAYNQARAAGATHEQSLQAAQEASTAYLSIAGKLMNGEELDDADAMDLAFLIPEIVGEVPSLRQPTRAIASKVKQRLQDTQLRQQAVQRLNVEADLEAIEALQPSAQPSPLADEPATSQLAVDEPVRSELEPLDTGLPPSSVQPTPRITPEESQARQQAGVANQMETMFDRARGAQETEYARQRDAAAGMEQEMGRVLQADQQPARKNQYAERLSQDDLASQAAQGRGADSQEVDLQRGLIEQIDHRGDDFVLVDIPTDQVRPLGSFSEDSTGRVQEYSGMSPETSPPVVAGRVEGGDGISIVDGKHRWAAAMVRGDSTVKAYVPEHLAREIQAGKQQEAPDGVRQEEVQSQNQPVQGRDAVDGDPQGVQPRRGRPQQDVRPQDQAGPLPVGDEDGPPTPEATRAGPQPQKARKLVRPPRSEPGPEASPLDQAEPQGRVRERVQTANRNELRRIIDEASLSVSKAGTNDAIRKRIQDEYDRDPEVRSRVDRVVQKGVEADRVREEGSQLSRDRGTGETDMQILDDFVQGTVDEAGGQVSKIDFGEMSNAELMRLGRLYSLDTAGKLDADQSIINTQLENRGLDRRKIDDASIARELDREIGGGEVGSPAEGSSTPSPQPRPRPSRKKPKKTVGSPESQPGAKSVLNAQTPKAQTRRARKLIPNEDHVSSPHRIIAEINRKLGIGSPGVGKSRILKTWALGFIRVKPEAIRLRMADALETHLHEVGHFLHKSIFQGGTTAAAIPNNRSGLSEAVFPRQWRGELEKLGRALYGENVPAAGYLSEGWAEWVRLAFTDPDAAKAKAPTVTKEAMANLAKDAPRVFEALEAFRKQYELYESASPTVKAAGYIRQHPVRDATLSSAYNKARKILFDRMHAMVQLKKDLGLDNLPADEDPHIVAKRAFGRASGDFKRAMEKGIFDTKTGKRVGKSLADVLRPARDHMVEMDIYLALRRAKEKRAQGHAGVMSRLSTKDIDDAISQIEDVFPEFKKVAEEFQQFNRWLIEDYAVQHGLLSKDQAKLIVEKNLEYVTFRKVIFDDDAASSGRVGKKFTDTGSGVKRFAQFAGEQIDPPIESFVAHMQGIMNRAQMNRVGQTVTDLFYKTDGMGRWIDKVDQPLGADVIPGDQVRKTIEKRLEEQGIDISEVDDDVVNLLMDLVEDEDFKRFRPVVRIDKSSRIFTVYKNGKPEFWQAKNNDLFEFLEGMDNPAAIEGLMTLLTLPKNIVRAGATGLNPEFFIPNFIRDFFNGLVFTSVGDAGFQGKAIINKERAKAVWKAFTEGKIEDAYLASGADMAGLFGEYYDPSTSRLNLDRMFEKPNSIVESAGKSISPRAYQKNLRDMMSGDFMLTIKGTGKMAAQPLMSFVEVTRVLNERFEMANRMAEFEAVLAETAIKRLKDQGIERPTAKQVQEWKAERKKEGWARADVEKAGQAAADITLDFQAGGTTARQLNQFIPFFNAMFLGADKLAREFKKHPYRTAGRTVSYVMIPTVAEHILNRNDEEYWNEPQEIRDRYWFLPMGDYDNDGEKEYIRIPRPYGLGSFAILTSRMLAAVDGIDPVTGKRGDPKALEAITDTNPLQNALLKDFRPAYNVPLITTAFELMANYSIFYDNNIVWRGEQQGVKSERGAERSTELAVVVGRMLDVEPPKVDYTIRSLFAGLGDNINKYAISPALKQVLNEDRPRRTRSRLDQPEDYPIIKRLLVEEPKTFSETMRRFYGTFTELEDINQSYRNRKRTDTEKAREYYERHAAEIQSYELLVASKTQIDELMKQLKAVYREQDITGQEFKDRTRELIDEIHEQARRGMISLDEQASKGVNK